MENIVILEGICSGEEKGTCYALGFEEIICHHSPCTIDQPVYTVQKEQDMELGAEVFTSL